MQVKQIVESEYPDLHVFGGEYPPSFQNKLLSRAVSAVQIGLFVLMAAGDRIFPSLGIAEPGFYRYMKERKMMSFIFIFMIGNQLSNHFWSTGAFEIYYKNSVVFSKLQTGRMPSVQEILDGIKYLKGN